MLGFELTFWDYATFAALAVLGLGFVGFLVWLAGLPGRIAIARNHPEAEAVKLLGWVGIMPTIYPWVQALIWAFKPTDIVDIRRFPAAEARAIENDIARLKGEAPTSSVESKEEPSDPTPPEGARPGDTKPGHEEMSK
jgi:hypothetical protein